MIKCYFGEEKYLVFSEFQTEKLKFKQKNPDAHIGEFDFEQGADLRQLKEELVTGGGLFSSKKLLVLRNIGKLDKIKQGQLLELLKATQVSKEEELEVIIVLLGKDKLEGKLKNFLTRKSQRKIETWEFKRKKGKELEKWIVTELEKRSDKRIGIEKKALAELILITNEDLWKISTELDKLICFVLQGKIASRDIQSLCNGNITAGIFELVDAIGARKLERAVTLKNRLLAQGENEFFVFSMIVTQFRNLIKISSCLAKGVHSPEQISKFCKIHPFVVKKSLLQLRSFSLDKLRKIYQLAADIDRETKVGQRDMQESLDYFIAKI